MKTLHLRQLLILIHSSLWFVPLLAILTAVALAVGAIWLDVLFGQELKQRWPAVFVTEAQSARSILTTISGSMATVAGVAFSITVVALTLASTQYSPRVLRNFMRDRGTQVVLGIFLGIFLYCLLVLSSVHGGANGDTDSFVPPIALTLAVVLAVLGIGAFIFFIHHMSASIQAAQMIQGITNETIGVVDRAYGDELGEDGHAPPDSLLADRQWQVIAAGRMGYIQTVSLDSLHEYACKLDTAVRMECEVGEFVDVGDPLASVALDLAPGESAVREINRAYGIDSFRTVDQDPAFGLRQLVDISLKALSPGINDTTTAAMCVEHIGVILSRCAPRELAARHKYDGDTVRVIARGRRFEDLVDLGFAQIMEYAQTNTEIVLRVLDALERVASSCPDARRKLALRSQLEMVEEMAMRDPKSSMAKEKIRRRLERVHKTL